MTNNYVAAKLTWQQISNQKNNLIKQVIRKRNQQKYRTKLVGGNEGKNY